MPAVSACACLQTPVLACLHCARSNPGLGVPPAATCALAACAPLHTPGLGTPLAATCALVQE
eukprot:12984909-Alexandrium_andersonii.AAC.1